MRSGVARLTREATHAIIGMLTSGADPAYATQPLAPLA